MEINNLEVFYFSPTGTTKIVLDGIVDGINPENVNFEEVQSLKGAVHLDKSSTDMVLIGMPTYISRIPPEAARELKRIKGKGIPVVLIAVYGNNKFGDILLEMKNIAKSAGFIPVAAGAFIGEHSFSTDELPIAADRPDNVDIKKAREFGKEIVEKLNEVDESLTTFDLSVPGAFPYREWKKLPAEPPATDEDVCIKCGRCKAVCPTDAICISDTISTDPNSCIFCCACVKICPVSARSVTSETILDIRKRLFDNCGERKDPELFF